MKTVTKRLLFYWVTSFILASIFYYILWIIMPRHNVFASLFRMFSYHWEYPISFIAIPCFFYGILAIIFTKMFLRQTVFKQILLTLLIVTLTILISSPFGGMLWHYYDMKAGYFPLNWILKMIKNGFSQGFEVGWLIILLSVPYNILGIIACYFLTKKGSELFNSN